MNPEGKDVGRFYCNFKVHKPHAYKETPPARPITSQSGTMTENIGTYIDYHINHIGTKHDSYLQDTPDFLRTIQRINRGQKLRENTLLVTLDVMGLYTNIIHDEGLEALEIELDKRTNPQVPTGFIINLMELLLKNSIFEFHDGYFKQNIGAAMGMKPIPAYANTFMATIDKKIKDLEGAEAITLLKRFLDDYFLIFQGSTKDLHRLFEILNQMHPTIKFTINHTSIKNKNKEEKCDCIESYSIPFLDVSCSIKQGRIETDLFTKETDKNQYLLPTSCHPKQTTNSIPFSLGLRIVRICSNTETRDVRLHEMKEKLIARNYNQDRVDSSIKKAKAVPRDRALKIANRQKQTQRPVLVIPYDPRLPAITSIQAKHWRAMVSQEPYLKEVFKEPPLTAYRRTQNLRGHLTRSKVAKKQPLYPRRYQKGMQKCGNNCTACPYIKECKSFKINGQEWKLKNQFNCNTYNAVYAIFCLKENCNNVYIGESKRMLWSRVADHRGYVSRSETDKATGAHFSLPGHSLADLRVTIIENTRGKSTQYRKEREHFYIRHFNTFYKGMNRQK